MLITSPVLLDQAVTRLFIQAIGGTAKMRSYLPDVASITKSKHRMETHPYLGAAPAMAEYRDELTFTPVVVRSQQLTNRKFGAGVQITEDDWNDDVLGGFPTMVQEMGDDFVHLINWLMVDALINADLAPNAGIDGMPIISASHPRLGDPSAPNQSNRYTGTGTTTAAVITDLNGVIARFGTFRRENGRQMGSVYRLTLLAPYAMREPITQALRATDLGGSSNVTLNDIQWKIIFDADLDADDANDYYVINSGLRTRPLILQEREPVRLIPEGRGVGIHFINEIRRYKVKWRGTPGYGPWQGVIKVENT